MEIENVGLMETILLNDNVVFDETKGGGMKNLLCKFLTPKEE